MTHPRAQTPVLRALFEDARPVVIGLPPKFSLSMALRTATRVRLATAFAHNSGWNLLKPDLISSKAEVRLLTGLDYCQTEPDLLASWLTLSRTRPMTTVHLAASPGPMFHPKVLIVHAPNCEFAIVGSANLSSGGFRDNIECSSYVDGGAELAQVEAWFDTLWSGPECSQELRKSDIDTYRPKYNKAKKSLAHARNQQKAAEVRIAVDRQARIGRWSKAVSAASKYLRSDRFKRTWSENYRNVAADIRRLLHYPDFDFTHEDWNEFYRILAFGHLIPIYRDVAFRKKVRLQNGLRHLFDEGIDIEQRLDDVLERDGRYAVENVGLNVISKVLGACQPHKWPVFNKPVRQTLKHFEYEPPWGASPGRKYLAFAELMSRFREECGAKNMLELDPFFFHYWDQYLRDE